MNLVPSNSILKQFQGATKNLPHITAWLSTFIDEGEELRLWQSDMSSAFYLFRLPRPWYKFLCFNVSRTKGENGVSGPPVTEYLACNVLPMGWSSSVAIMQEISEKLLDLPQLPRESQLVRGRPVPLWMVGIAERAKELGKTWWHVYLDNFAAGEVASVGSEFSGGDFVHSQAEAAWETAGVVSSARKRKAREISAQELGAFFSGEQRTMGPSAERLLTLVQSTVWLLARTRLSKRLVQVIAGRWIHVFQYRRPAMSFLEATWEFTSSTGLRLELQSKVRREFFCCLSALPFLQSFLGAPISEVTTASDASHFGGAVGIAKSLTESGSEFLRHAISTPPVNCSGIMILSLFNGIGGAFRAYDILGIKPLALVAYDIHSPAQRVTSRRWPTAELHGDVRELDAAQVEQWLLRYPGLLEIHLWGGFPCVDLSSVKFGGKGLAGPQSSLFFELPRIKKLLEDTVPAHVRVKYVAENVASMAKSECDKISEALGVRPYHFNCAHAVPMQRPRLCWISEQLEGCLHGLQFVDQAHWIEVIAAADYPFPEDWIEENWVWQGGHEGHTLPTALKSIVRKRPPPAPAGISRCDADTLARYEADSFRFPPYHYLPGFYSGRVISGDWPLAARKNSSWATGMVIRPFVSAPPKSSSLRQAMKTNGSHFWVMHLASFHL